MFAFCMGRACGVCRGSRLPLLVALLRLLIRGTRGTAATCVTTSLATTSWHGTCRQTDQGQAKQLQGCPCLQQWACCCGLLLCLHTCSCSCSYIHLRVQAFSHSETFPYQGDDRKYGKQTSIYKVKCATSSSFTTHQYSLRVILLSSEEKKINWIITSDDN